MPAGESGNPPLSGEGDLAWWQPYVVSPQLGPGRSAAVSLASLVPLALQNSKQIRVTQLGTFIEREQVTQADARFDWTAFAQAVWTDTDEPTGSRLDAGDAIARRLEENFLFDIGVRRTNRLGGKFELGQNLATFHSNSEFVIPPEQGLARLTLRYNQPLLKDGGKLVNEGQVILAQLGAEAVGDEAQSRIDQLLFEVVRAYWDVYRARARFCIQESLVRSTEDLLADLRQRGRIDAEKSLLAEVASRLATQRAELVDARVNVERAQHALVRQVGDRQLDCYEELIPQEAPSREQIDVDVGSAFATALQHRGDLRAAMKGIQSTQLDHEIAQHQLLPRLGLILEANVAGINGDYAAFRSFADQFHRQGPSYTAGLAWEFPIGNRDARSRARQTELEVAREVAAFEDRIDVIRQEVRDALASLRGRQEQLAIREDAVIQATIEIEAMQRRRRIFPDEFDRVSQLYLRQYLEALEQRAFAEAALVTTQVDYAVDVVQLRRVLGILLIISTRRPGEPPAQDVPPSGWTAPAAVSIPARTASH
jgi:outer membrane protein TolC